MLTEGTGPLAFEGLQQGWQKTETAGPGEIRAWLNSQISMPPHLNPQFLKLNNSKRSWGRANLVCISIPSLPVCVLGHIAQLPKSQFFSREKWGYYDVPLRAIVKIKHKYTQAPSTVSGTNQELRGKSLLLSTLEKCISTQFGHLGLNFPAPLAFVWLWRVGWHAFLQGMSAGEPVEAWAPAVTGPVVALPARDGLWWQLSKVDWRPGPVLKTHTDWKLGWARQQAA